MRELITRTWCDPCYLGGWDAAGPDTLTEATATYSISISSGEAAGQTKLLELCDAHAAPFAALAELAARLPTIGSTPSAAAAARAPSRAVQGPPSQAPAECPVCSAQLSQRSSLVGHIWGKHRTDARVVPGGEIPCPECGERITSTQAMAQHRGNAHGVSALVEALSGVPGWTVLSAEHWLRQQ